MDTHSDQSTKPDELEHLNFLETIIQGNSSKGPWFLERLFINLKVLSRLREGQKLYVKEEVLAIEDLERPNVVRSIVRWWYSESRNETLRKVQKIIQEAIDCGKKAIESNYLNKDTRESSGLSRNELKKRVNIRDWEETRDRELHMGNNALLRKLIEQFSVVSSGIKELEKTYKDDMTLCSKLELELELIGRANREFSNYLNSVER